MNPVLIVFTCVFGFLLLCACGRLLLPETKDALKSTDYKTEWSGQNSETMTLEHQRPVINSPEQGN